MNYCTSSNRDLIYDIKDKQYVDAQMWHSSCNFGYNNKEIQKKVAAQLEVLPQVSGDFLHIEKLELAKIVEEEVFKRTGLHGRISFNVSGTLVVEDALKLMRKHSNKAKVAAFMGCYHGRSLTVSGISSSHRYRHLIGDFFPYAAKLFPYANCNRCFYEMKPDTCNSYCAKMVRKNFETDFYGITDDTKNEIGGFLFEICQGRSYTIPPKEFIQDMFALCKERGILTLADEIQTGMYRTGKLFAFEHYGVIPDMITMSKSFSNGLTPLSMLWVRDDLSKPDQVTPGHAHSNFANHVLGTTAALATWNYMLKQDYETQVSIKGKYLLDKLQALAANYDFIGSVDGLGLLLNIHFMKDGVPFTNLGKTATIIAQDGLFKYKGQEYGLILNSGGYSNDALKLAPSLDSSIDDLDRLTSLIAQLLNKLSTMIQQGEVK